MYSRTSLLRTYRVCRIQYTYYAVSEVCCISSYTVVNRTGPNIAVRYSREYVIIITRFYCNYHKIEIRNSSKKQKAKNIYEISNVFFSRGLEVSCFHQCQLLAPPSSSGLGLWRSSFYSYLDRSLYFLSEEQWKWCHQSKNGLFEIAGQLRLQLLHQILGNSETNIGKFNTGCWL